MSQFNTPAGAIRFNTDTMKLEYYHCGPVGLGTQATGEWVQVTTDSPDVITGGTRALFGGGYTYPSPVTNYDIIDYINIASTGNAVDFGNLIGSNNNSRGATASRIRAIWGGGNLEPATNTDAMDYVTIASEGDAIDFGNLATSRRTPATCSNGVRGLWAGGRTPSVLTVIEHVSISSTGDAVAFGDLNVGVVAAAGMQSPTRGIFAGGYKSPVPTHLQKGIQYVTIASSGKAEYFGDLTGTNPNGGGSSNAVRGICLRVDTPAGGIDLEYITIATLGNAQDFGDLLGRATQVCSASSPTRAVWAGGYTAPAANNIIAYVQFSTLGNATDFGDLTQARMCDACGATSNGHGGLG